MIFYGNKTLEPNVIRQLKIIINYKSFLEYSNHSDSKS